MKKIIWTALLFFWIALGSNVSAAALPGGFGRVTWGMTKEEIVALYRIEMIPPKNVDAEGIWAVDGPAPGELTVSGEAIGEEEVRSVSFGIHPELGVVIIHVRFKDKDSPKHVENLLPKWTSLYGPPKERLSGPRIIWEDATTHVELTYHTVSPSHPTSSDHMAIVLWNIPLMDKIDAESEELHHVPDVEKLIPMEEPHKEEPEE